MRRRRAIRTSLAALAIGSSTLLAPTASAQSASGAGAPAAFDVDAAAVPIIIGASAPSALPLDLAAGVGFTGAKLNSQPKGTAEAGPGYVPLLGALPLLGGPGALPAIGVRLLPGLLVGFPTIIGLPPVPIDPTLVPAPNVPTLPAPALPPLECFASVPGDVEPVSCGGPTQDALGFSIGAASGTATAEGDASDPSTLKVTAAVRGGGFVPSSANTLLPISAGTVASSATSYIEGGRVVAGVSTAVQDLSFFGSVKIPSLETSITAALDGTPEHAAAHGERCTIGGATVAGVPVSIDGDGVHAAGQNASSSPVLAAEDKLVQTTLTTLGITLKTLASGKADPGNADGSTFPGDLTLAPDGTKLRASLACLEMSYKIPTSGTVMTLTFGQATLAMQAFTAAPLAAVPSGGSNSSTNTSDKGGATPTGAATTSAKASGSKSAAAPSLPPAPTPGAGAPTPSKTAFQQIGFGWKIPYPPFALLALALPLMIWSRRVGPLHLPGLRHSTRPVSVAM